MNQFRNGIREPTCADIVDPKVARQAIRAFVRRNARRPELYHFMADTGRSDNDRLAYLVEHHLPEWLGHVGRLAEGDLDAAHIYYALAGASSLLFGVASEVRSLTGIDPSDETVIERHADYIANLFVP